MQQNRQERSISELFADLVRETGDLVRKEIQLARVEVGEKVSDVSKNVGFLAVGGAIAYAGLLAILAAIIIALGQIGLPWWLSALIVGLVVAGVGYFLVQKGLNAIKAQNLAPQKTLETLKEDVEWAKEQTS
jgi:xanthine/uracil permease